jgi:hypothetical protein
VLVEGADTGLSTPTWIPLNGGVRALTIRREGFRDETFSVGNRFVWEGATPNGSRALRYLSVPLPWVYIVADFLVPVRVRSSRAPSHVHFKLLPR